MHQTVRKQAEIEARADSDINKPFYADVTIVQQGSDGTWAPRLQLQESANIVCCKDLEGGLSLGIISFGKALVIRCKFTLRPVRRRFLKGANPCYPFTPSQWTQMGPFATPPFFS